MTPGAHHETKGVRNISPCFLFKNKKKKRKKTKFCRLTSSPPMCTPTRQVVDVASVHQEVPVLRVAEGRHVPGEGHAGTDVPPQGACGTRGREWRQR